MKYLILLLLNFTLLDLMGQNVTPRYFEPAPKDMIRFFFDENYFMVDKECEFKYIERVSAFNKASNKFEGQFKDFDQNGRLILIGQYSNGNKEGEFKAFHPNGALKWETTFINNKATGPWKYYYPDGKPMLFITLGQPDFSIDQYWDRTGKQSVKDGDGLYNIDLPILGFTEHGYTKFNRHGKVKNGQPDGIWYISFIVEGKKKEKIHAYTEQYEDGQLKGKKVSDNFYGIYIPEQSLIFTPESYFPRAELLLSKNCSFDEFTGFNIFLSEKFTQFLKQLRQGETQDYDLDLSYTLHVSKKGIPTRVELVSLPDSFTDYQRAMFTKMVANIRYYLPSYLSGEPIDDRLDLSFKVKKESSEIYVSPVQIKRHKGM